MSDSSGDIWRCRDQTENLFHLDEKHFLVDSFMLLLTMVWMSVLGSTFIHMPCHEVEGVQIRMLDPAVSWIKRFGTDRILMGDE